MNADHSIGCSYKSLSIKVLPPLPFFWQKSWPQFICAIEERLSEFNLKPSTTIIIESNNANPNTSVLLISQVFEIQKVHSIQQSSEFLAYQNMEKEKWSLLVVL